MGETQGVSLENKWYKWQWLLAVLGDLTLGDSLRLNKTDLYVDLILMFVISAR